MSWIVVVINFQEEKKLIEIITWGPLTLFNRIMRPDQYDEDQENKMIKGLFLGKFVPKIIHYFAVGKKTY